MDDYSKYIAKSRYARYLEDEHRREEWDETVMRFCNFFSERNEKFPKQRIFDAINSLEVVPSMRALMTAGKALDRDNVAGFNCSFVAVDDPRAFDEILYILMCGTGVGFTVERQQVAKLPAIPEELFATETTISVRDSKIGWATAFRELVSLLYSGRVPQWDLSKLRPAGARLKTFGGRSSGPDPLNDLFNFTVNLFKRAVGRKLSSLEAHDLVCKIADVVVVGGVRRSALISLSNLSDERMRNAKNGQWWEDNVQRALANNSVAYTEKPDIEIFMKEWLAHIGSKSGERGIFNRVSAQKQAQKTGRRDWKQDFGTNPCGEIILRPNSFCNLSEVVIREDDTLETLKNKVEIATIIGTFQSTLTQYRYLRPIWRKNAEEERLLGVSLTGIMDHPVLNHVNETAKEWLNELRIHAIYTNKAWSFALGINSSVSITTVKPSGTVSQLVDSASGIHARFAPYYIRTVRADKLDPIGRLLQDAGVPVEDDVTKPDKTNVFSFPMKAPSSAVFTKDRTAIQQLEHYMMVKECWSEHNPSITVYVKQDDWLEVGAWVYKNFDLIGGVSFLPQSDHVYKQAPYQEITQEQYEELIAKFPKIDWSKLASEDTDNTTAVQTLACSSGVCDIL
jgi:ribonucleoside-diphosphate reductase alpha chain